MERNHELVLPNLVKWNGPLMQSFWILPLNFYNPSFIFHISVCFYYLNLQDACFSPTFVSFSTFTRKFSLYNLQGCYLT